MKKVRSSRKNKFFSLKKICIFLAILIFSASPIKAEWNPEYCFLDEDESVLNELNKPAYKTLKLRVEKYLENTWCSKEKVNLIMDVISVTKPQICVEVGAFTGSSVLPIACTLQYLGKGKVFAIDAWDNAEVVKYLDNDDPNRAWWSQVNMQQAYNTMQGRLGQWRLFQYCNVIRSPSSEAVKQVNNIDFLHLDGDYSEKGSLKDIELYLPKVKTGGYILFSNLFIMVKNKQPKLKAFCALFESCELVAEIENDNAVLFKKL